MRYTKHDLLISQEGKWILQGHLAYANPHWKSIQRYEEEKLTLLIEFRGSHTYISPSAYKVGGCNDHSNN